MIRVRSGKIIIGLSGRSKLFFFCLTERVLINVDHLFLLRILDIFNWDPATTIVNLTSNVCSVIRRTQLCEMAGGNDIHITLMRVFKAGKLKRREKRKIAF